MKRILVFSWALFVLHISYGQVHLGLKAGINLSNIKTTDNNNPRIGLNAGGLLQFNISDKILIRPELLYSIKGYRSPATQFSGEAIVSLNYINMPILFGFKPIKNLSFLIGPELGFLTGARSKFDGNNINISKNYRQFDIGVDVNVTYNLSKYIGLDLRYCYGFKGLMEVIYTDQNGNVIGHGKAGGNQVLQLGLCYIFSK